MIDFATSKTRVHATTSNESQAAAITRRLQDDEGLNAVLLDVADITLDGFPIGTMHRYAVLILDEAA